MTTDNIETAQTTLLHTAARNQARKEAIKRIEAIMLPGARALAGTRHAKSEYWIQIEHDLSGVAPIAPNKCRLIWRDQGSDNARYGYDKPYDSERISYYAQVVVDDAINPEQLTEIARIATVYTAQIVRESEATTAAQVAGLQSEITALQAVAPASLAV